VVSGERRVIDVRVEMPRLLRVASLRRASPQDNQYGPPPLPPRLRGKRSEPTDSREIYERLRRAYAEGECEI
jgi:hypothetical protein